MTLLCWLLASRWRSWAQLTAKELPVRSCLNSLLSCAAQPVKCFLKCFFKLNIQETSRCLSKLPQSLKYWSMELNVQVKPVHSFSGPLAILPQIMLSYKFKIHFMLSCVPRDFQVALQRGADQTLAHNSVFLFARQQRRYHEVLARVFIQILKADAHQTGRARATAHARCKAMTSMHRSCSSRKIQSRETSPSSKYTTGCSCLTRVPLQPRRWNKRNSTQSTGMKPTSSTQK